MSLLHRAAFSTTVAALDQLAAPGLAEGIPEVAFVGRSNAGKSTAINLLCNQKRLAFASKTPGRTQHLNFFAVADRDRTWGYLVDLPGYGYAQTARDARAGWDLLLGSYLRERAPLVGIVMLADARRGLGDLDRTLIDWVTPAGRPIHVLLTKSDKLNHSQRNLALQAVRRELDGTPHTAQAFSALDRRGLEEAQAKVLAWFGAPPEPVVVPTKKSPGGTGARTP